LSAPVGVQEFPAARQIPGFCAAEIVDARRARACHQGRRGEGADRAPPENPPCDARRSKLLKIRALHGRYLGREDADPPSVLPGVL
jgi:hypothetical protein